MEWRPLERLAMAHLSELLVGHMWWPNQGPTSHLWANMTTHSDLMRHTEISVLYQMPAEVSVDWCGSKPGIQKKPRGKQTPFQATTLNSLLSLQTPKSEVF